MRCPLNRSKELVSIVEWNFHTEIWIHWEGRRRNPSSGGEDFPSRSAAVVGHRLLLNFICSHISAAMCEGVVADVVGRGLC